MSTEKFAALDAILQQKHAEMYASLNKGKDANSSLPASLREWYKWQDGQNRESENLLFDWYRFYSSEEARQRCVSQTEYSLPLLTDDVGLGYWFSTLSHNVFYNCEECYDTSAQLFASFDSFIDFLIEFADSPQQSISDVFDREEKLLAKYTRHL